MTHRKSMRKTQHTTPDHRPMITVFRGPEDPVDTAVRTARRRYEEINPNDRINWR